MIAQNGLSENEFGLVDDFGRGTIDQGGYHARSVPIRDVDSMANI